MFDPTEEMVAPDNTDKYYGQIGDSRNQLVLFIDYCQAFSDEAETRTDQVFVGIDYEFNNRQIAVMQLAFERAPGKDNHLWALNPAELDKRQTNILINRLMRNRKIFKILHGADSLDIPYMFKHLFKDNKDTIADFMSRFIDTRFMCEFGRVITNKERRCNIYNGLLQYNTIDQEKNEQLHQNHDEMGPVQNISWNIHKMTIPTIKYALYDVIFLRRFMLDIARYIKNNKPSHYPFIKLFNRFTQFIILEKKGATDVLLTAKQEVDPVNNFMFQYRGKKMTLIAGYQQLITGFKIPSIGLYIDDLMMIPFFRAQISMLMKRIIYAVLMENHQVYENRLTPTKRDLRFSKFMGQITNSHSLGIQKLVEMIHQQVISRHRRRFG